ncbi:MULTISPECIES: TlpA family protein disulfide reductase [Pasteurellaceae]|uniref:TlpA disulfide reductase family protein n=1 Tax=Pasteurella atlantica TaxID=2827233 RepID=A0AAW8CF18_9PAST|nr:TlpA disulfide reductase family protein [Pasteurella atlantica]MBR0572643.1 TlpA family protein disulfide reductase [Pasteurella atlantica]MDP8038589.1 TlpA disulfide reductase family protein [Pasteurella atlantica]MDP8040681.1 TlpA disulfide reductase family protein [Pasteurella atlantica]MDP8042816.1 TlpA disulfide reductase family protein [Pasteurella atlantica]MDP8044903.1 TlpA disulfide reductase family protein [Pasteurella atlantica]
MKNSIKLFLIINVIFIVSSCKEQTLALGELAPDLAIKNAQGQRVKLSDYKDQPILLEFWSQTCGACIAAVPILNKLHQQNKERLVIISIATDMTETQLNIYKEEKKIEYLLTADQLNISQERYKVMGYPTIFYLNKNHILERVQQGLSSDPNWQVNITKWITKQN